MADRPVSLGPSAVGTVCEQYESPVTEVCFPLPRYQGLGDRRSEVRTSNGSGLVRLPTSSPDRTISPTIESGEVLEDAVSGTVVSPSQVGTTPTLSTSGSRDSISMADQTAGAAALELRPSLSTQDKLDPVLAGEERLRKLGYSDAVIKRLALAHAASTKVQYRSKWLLFVSWAEEQTPKAYDPTSPTLLMLTEFLAHLFQVRGLTPGTIANYRSAIGYYWKRFYHFEIPTDDVILKDLVKGFQRERPPAKKRVVGWDVKLVLYSSSRTGSSTGTACPTGV